MARSVQIFSWTTALVLTMGVSLAQAQTQTVIGWLETVEVSTESEKLSVLAKIDSGADNSSLHATDIEVFTKLNQNWVTFKTVNNLVLEAPLIRYAHIKTKNQGLQKRPAVRLQLCLNGVKRAVEVNLVNRQHFKLPLLVGRSALFNVLIDPQNTELLSPKRCD